MSVWRHIKAFTEKISATTDTNVEDFITSTDIDFLNKRAFDVYVQDSFDHVHRKIHEGKFFNVSHIFPVVANSTPADILIDIGSTSDLHSAFAVDVGGNSYFSLFEGATVSANGTALESFNNLRSSTTTADASFYYSPTLITTGSYINEQLIPGGKGGSAIGGGDGGLARAGSEIILASDTKYLLRCLNQSGQDRKISISIGFYIR